MKGLPVERMSYPKIVALDTDWTIWQGFLDSSKWGKGWRAHDLVEDNIERVNRRLLRDKSSPVNWILLNSDIPTIINDIVKNGAKLAIVSRNNSKAMCDRALYYFNAINPKDGKDWSIIHLVQYDEVVDQSKVEHFRRIRAWSGSDFSDMLFFDDEAFNNCTRIELGVTFQLARDRKGLTWDVYQQGLNAWRRAKKIAIPPNPSSVPKRVLIGYSGLSSSWIELVRKGEGIVDNGEPARWGYALYVADDIKLAKFFRDWARRGWGHESYVCEVWVKDYDAWARINKIWVPENDGNVPQMNNMNWTAEESGRNQEDRDRFMADHWNIYTPYILFSRHHWMPGMSIPIGQRWSEMVVYTQIQRSFFEVTPLSDSQVDGVVNPSPYPFHHQFKTWDITVPSETRQEFLKRGETDFYRLSEDLNNSANAVSEVAQLQKLKEIDGIGMLKTPVPDFGTWLTEKAEEIPETTESRKLR